ncbi:ATP-binding protein [Sphingomonas olei]|uniref:Sensor histidine kinase n=1 Tax=Sphingomonas olei TaxID=1886787 RepID=A0ABY2QJT2_9SPHN|nr:ATP-binding protein [Sphingomonas olei]THG40996.1 sensor histidine kinase [Sphingomonas olei]
MSLSRPDATPRKIAFPNRLSFESGCVLAETVRGLAPEGRYIFDLSGMQWVEPFAMLHVASTVAQKIDACPKMVIAAVGHTNGYARFMGFFRELGIPGEGGASPPENHENYLPIQTLNLREVRADAARRDMAPGQIIETHTRNIARTLARQNYGPLWETIQYALREIIRNAAEHSKCDHVLYCGQFWPTKNKVEVAILDEGIGIVRSLQKNPLIQEQSEFDLLRLSLKPGISGVHYEGAQMDENNVWANSGFGLYVVSELCKRGGSLTVLSGNSGIRVSSDGESAMTGSHAGTALRLIINTSNLRSIAASLALIVAKGEQIARTQNVSRSSASGASKRLFD